jgi:hypothetical protein
VDFLLRRGRPALEGYSVPRSASPGWRAHLVALEVTFLGLLSKAEAQTMKPIQEPITAKEDLGDLSEPQQALAQFYKAITSRDLAMIDANFAATDEVAIDNSLGGIRRGGSARPPIRRSDSGGR